jgi:hypothetical protein
MTDAAAVVLCALALLGRSPETMPRIELVDLVMLDHVTDGMSPIEGYVIRGSGTISVVTSSAAFRTARCGRRRSLLKLASILAHEEWHVRCGGDERGAYEAQLAALVRLGAGPETAVYQQVRQAMFYVLASDRYAAILRATRLRRHQRSCSREPGVPDGLVPRAPLAELRLEARE